MPASSAGSSSPRIEAVIQWALANESETKLSWHGHRDAPPITAGEARRMMECLQQNPRLDHLSISWYRLDICVYCLSQRSPIVHIVDDTQSLRYSNGK
jgi:hypothetical protein